MEDRIEYPNLHCTTIDFNNKTITISQRYPYVETLEVDIVRVLVARAQLWLKMQEE